MVKIRLSRRGKKRQPYYRVIVADVRAPRDGKFIEHIGFYNPMVKEDRVHIDMERANYWLSVGAQPTDRVRKLIDLIEKGDVRKSEKAAEAKPKASKKAEESSEEKTAAAA